MQKVFGIDALWKAAFKAQISAGLCGSVLTITEKTDTCEFLEIEYAWNKNVMEM